ncbi:hypothetical protein [Acinetobacter seifertii]|uniref:hypothetical protein n=1 Tax=Acinetobacter seifertii TaxID=1530123 RepID=UPI00386246A6
MTSITISLEKFLGLTKSTQDEILNVFREEQQTVNINTVEGELTRKQVNALLNGLSEKSKTVLKVLVENFDNNHIHYDELIKTLDMVDENLTGVWSGITKRSRNIANDSNFDLIDWNTRDKYGSVIGMMHPITFSHIAAYFR